MFMQLNQEIFAIKLYELEQQYGQMISRLRLCRENSQETIRQKRRALQDEYREHDLQLKTTAESSRSPAVADLARLHLECFQGAEEILSRKLPSYLHSESSSQQEDQAEAAALYAEYAIDFAVQSMRYALIAALNAMDAQMGLQTETENENVQHTGGNI